MTTETLVASEVDLDRLAVDTVRVLAMDAIQKAGSGHPGTAMALAPAAYVLWTRFLKFDPADPQWPDRDRFVLSNGHASVLQYAVLHLTGYPLGIRDLKQQRQWGSLTPGHPEYGHTPGVEITTGPLGQGVGNAVGFAIATAILSARIADYTIGQPMRVQLLVVEQGLAQLGLGVALLRQSQAHLLRQGADMRRREGQALHQSQAGSAWKTFCAVSSDPVSSASTASPATPSAAARPSAFRPPSSR